MTNIEILRMLLVIKDVDEIPADISPDYYEEIGEGVTNLEDIILPHVSLVIKEFITTLNGVGDSREVSHVWVVFGGLYYAFEGDASTYVMPLSYFLDRDTGFSDYKEYCKEMEEYDLVEGYNNHPRFEEVCVDD